MARINLLPWRAERRRQRQREFYGMLAFSAVGGVLLSILIYAYYGAQISGQNARNAFLREEIRQVEQQIVEIDKLDKQRDRLLARKKVIEELQANRSQMVHLFDSLVRTIPDGVVLTSLKQEGDLLTLEGRSQSNARVSAYMRNLEGSGWMTRPELSIIEAKQDDKAATRFSDASALPYMFTLQVRLASPNEGEDGEQVLSAIPDGSAGGVAAASETAPSGTASPDAATPADAAAAQPAPSGAGAPGEAQAEQTQGSPAS